MLITPFRRLGTFSCAASLTDDIIGVSGATYTDKLVRFLYSAVRHVSLEALQIVACLQLTTLKLIFSATLVSLNSSLENQYLKRDYFKFRISRYNNIAKTVHVAAYQPQIENRLNFCMSGGRSARLRPPHQQCVASACS